MDQDQIRQRQEGIRPLPPVGRARGLLAIWEQTRREEEMRIRRRDIWSPVSVTPDQGRVATLVLLSEAASRNGVRAPSPIPIQRRGRGRGLSALLPNHPLPPSGMGRARSRDTGPCQFPDPSL